MAELKSHLLCRHTVNLKLNTDEGTLRARLLVPTQKGYRWVSVASVRSTDTHKVYVTRAWRGVPVYLRKTIRSLLRSTSVGTWRGTVYPCLD